MRNVLGERSLRHPDRPGSFGPRDRIGIDDPLSDPADRRATAIQRQHIIADAQIFNGDFTVRRCDPRSAQKTGEHHRVTGAVERHGRSRRNALQVQRCSGVEAQQSRIMEGQHTVVERGRCRPARRDLVAVGQAGDDRRRRQCEIDRGRRQRELPGAAGVVEIDRGGVQQADIEKSRLHRDRRISADVIGEMRSRRDAGNIAGDDDIGAIDRFDRGVRDQTDAGDADQIDVDAVDAVGGQRQVDVLVCRQIAGVDRGLRLGSKIDGQSHGLSFLTSLHDNGRPAVVAAGYHSRTMG